MSSRWPHYHPQLTSNQKMVERYIVGPQARVSTHYALCMKLESCEPVFSRSPSLHGLPCLSSTREQNSHDTSAFYSKKHISTSRRTERITHIHPLFLVAKPSPPPFSPRYIPLMYVHSDPENQVRLITLRANSYIIQFSRLFCEI
jgi:hypothetical protein